MHFQHQLFPGASVEDQGSILKYGAGYVAIRDENLDCQYCSDEVEALLFIRPQLSRNQAEQIMDVMTEELADNPEAVFEPEDWF